MSENKYRITMKLGRAELIFRNIKSKEFNEIEKGLAIRKIIDMETHNSITKDNILEALDWLWNKCYELREEQI